MDSPLAGSATCHWRKGLAPIRVRRTRQRPDCRERRHIRASRTHRQAVRSPNRSQLSRPRGRGTYASGAEAVFAAVRERVLAVGSFESAPSGFDGFSLVAKHHPRLQCEIVSLLGSLDAGKLGPWVVRGWNDTITEQKARDDLTALMQSWATQDSNDLLNTQRPQCSRRRVTEGADGNVELDVRFRIRDSTRADMARGATCHSARTRGRWDASEEGNGQEAEQAQPNQPADTGKPPIPLPPQPGTLSECQEQFLTVRRLRRHRSSCAR